MCVCVCVCVDFPDDDTKRRQECPVAHVIQLPQLCRDDELSGGSGLLREDNIAQVCEHNWAPWLIFHAALA